VPRFTRVKVNYTNTAGESISQELEGFVARVFQHEYDHLDGVVYLDRVENNRNIISEGEFAKLMASSAGI
jgi:peptide deformylase